MSSFRSLVLALSVLPVYVAAQETATDTTPFHRGQWAMQFGGNANLFSLGLLHFTSPRSAWLFDVRTSTSVVDAKSTDNFGTATSADNQFINLDVRLGKRFYRTRTNVVSFHTLGIEGGWTDQKADVTGTHVYLSQWNAGINLELGAAYMLSDGVSVGGTALFSAGYQSYKVKDSFRKETGHGYYDDIRVLISLGLYF